MEIVTLAVLTLLVIVCGGAGVYLAELGNPGANTTNLGDAFWWAVVTIATVGYGDYYPVTAVGRVIAASSDVLRNRHLCAFCRCSLTAKI